MKLLLLSVFCIFSVFAFAQTLGNNDPKVMKQFDLYQKLRSRKINNDSLMKIFQNYIALNKKHDRVIYLPQDNMPYIVPDTKVIVAIPNASQKFFNP